MWGKMSNNFERKNAALWATYALLEEATKNATNKKDKIKIDGAVVHPEDSLRLCVYATHSSGTYLVTCLRPDSTVPLAMSGFKPISALPPGIAGPAS